MSRVVLWLTLLFWVAPVCAVHAASESAVCFKCHKKADFSAKIVHRPVAQGKCESCHNPHVARYKGLLQKPDGQLCESCHKKREWLGNGAGGRVIHEPVRQGQCLKCHDPHKSEVKGLVHGKLADRCFACHKDLPKKFEGSTHSPYAKGRCIVCHLPHVADNYQMLRTSPDKLCLKCHQRKALNKAHKGYPVEIKDCLSCHNPHGSKRKYLIRNFLHEPFKKNNCKVCHSGGQPGTEVCLKCHKDISKKVLTLHNHFTSSTGNSCIICHSPHAGDTSGLLKGRQAQICRSCHEDTFKRDQDKIYRHPKVSHCGECHNVHGSNRLAMFRSEGSAVCERCHETQGKFTHPLGDKVRDPRTGQKMTCISCHKPMGTDYKYELLLSGEKDLCIQCHRNY